MKKYSLIFLFIFLSGCVTTSLYGAKFVPSGENTYTLKVAFGGLPTTPMNQIEASTRKVVVQEANKFISSHKEYSEYQIVDYKRTSYLNYIIYTVKFKG